jgi:carboxyl-terminal processing protease
VLTGALFVTVIFALVTAGFFKFYYHDQSDLLNEETEEKLTEVYSVLQSTYYEDIDDSDLSTGLIKGMVEGLNDPYSVYYTAEEYADFMIDATGSYAGIGAVLSKDATSGAVSIINVYEGSPAEESGLKKGDIIISADGHEGVEEELNIFVQSIRGEEGTDVALEILRDGKTLEVTCTRRAIQVPSVKYRMLKDANGNEDIGYIQIAEFSEGTYDEFVKALTDLQSQGMKAVIYDVRSNPGGMLSSVTNMLDYILPEGTTVYMLDKQDNKTEYTSDAKHHLDIPTVVLTNGESASASEIFSGAVRDFKYGTLIGTTTYGKGVVQNTYPFKDGSAVKVTIASYYTPNGECIHKKGIKPDVVLEYEYTGDEDAEYDYYADNQVVAGIEELSKQIQ